MRLTPGTLLGPYQIVDEIGAGGMGAVYRARDTRLNRDVAVKVLPEEFSAHPKMRERLGREARAISALSHPNICALYDVGSSNGVDYLVMELLDGESLATRLRRGALSIAQALRYAAEIAAALDAAHRAGVVHRDLKPGNIMLTKNGARLLDFGLAKQDEQAAHEQNETRARTAEAPLTEPGFVVGTLQYMSPEQIEGREVDGRSDIFSFGAVLYEMVSGRRAFEGASSTEVISKIVRDDPPLLRATRTDVPEAVERLVGKCLEKDPDARWQSARDLADELRWIAGSASGSAVRSLAGRRRSVLPWLIAAGGVIVAVVAGALLLRPARLETPVRTVRFSIDPPPGSSFTQRATNTEIAVSPDGTRIAFVSVRGGHRSLLVRSLDALATRELENTDGAMSPFWSPDSSTIGFFANGFMKKIAATGGAVQTICKAAGGTASWGTRGLILFAEWGPAVTPAIESVPENGGTPREVTEGHTWHFWPAFLPDGQHFLYRLVVVDPAVAGIYVASIDGPKAQRIMNAVSRVEVARDNWLYFVREGALVKQKFDLGGAKMLGQPVTLAQPVFSFLPTANANFSVDAEGDVVAYQRVASDVQLVWKDRDGHTVGRLASIPRVRSFSISPDGQRIAIERFEAESGVSNVWMYDTTRDVITRLTGATMGCFTPIWSHDGHELVVSAIAPTRETDPPQLSILGLSGGPTKPLMSDDGVEYPTDVLKDGKSVIYTVNRGAQKDIEMLSMSGDRRRRAVISGDANQSDGFLSPDERWIAYTSDESGRPEIYVSPFGVEGEKTLVSTEGGTEAQWSPDGRELFYMSASGMLMRVNVDGSAALRVSRPVAMFPVSSAFMLELEEFRLPHYAVAPDGKRFLVRELATGRDDNPVAIIVGPGPPKF